MILGSQENFALLINKIKKESRKTRKSTKKEIRRRERKERKEKGKKESTFHFKLDFTINHLVTPFDDKL